MRVPGEPGSGAVLIGDIGGTNARFALVEGSEVQRLARVRVADHADAQPALATVLEAAGRPVRGAVLAVAGPVHRGRARLTNGAWAFDEAALAEALGLERVLLVNDFAAQALALPDLQPADLLHLSGPSEAAAEGGEGLPAAPRAVLGPGTGLGVAALMADGDPVVGEGGHVTLPAYTEREWQALGPLRRRYGHVSAERVVSGPGLVDLYAALVELDGGPSLVTAADVVAAAQRGEPLASEAVSLFFAFLGTVAADVALTFGARGGVYLAGGILPRLPDALQASGFAERFLSKGRFRAYLEELPVFLVTHSDPALLGLARRARLL